MARKRNNIVKFPKSPTRIRAAKNQPPLDQRFNNALNALIERDGFQKTYHSMADLAEKMRKHLLKQA